VRLDWRSIQKRCTEAAQKMGHELGPFKPHGRGQLRMASCDACYGCCWVAYQPSRGFGAGGRLLMYACGTNEAAGLLPTEPQRLNTLESTPG
jgi:hypothetical protein